MDRKVDLKLENGSKESVKEVKDWKLREELQKRQVPIDQRDASAIQTVRKQRDKTHVHVGSDGDECKPVGMSCGGTVRFGFKNDQG